MAFESITTTALVFKKYYSKIFKSGSLTLAVLIPLTVFLSEFGFLDDSIVHIVTTMIIFIGLIEVLFNIFMNKYEATKVRLLKLKIDMEEQNKDTLQNYIDKEQTSNEVLKKEVAVLVRKIAELKIVKKDTSKSAESISHVESVLSIPEVENTEFVR